MALEYLTLILPPTHAADVASWLGIPRLRKEDPLCRENVQFMRNELANCVLNCDHYKANDFLPSRLLDLGPQTSFDSIRLIDSSQSALDGDSETPQYAALSYCWGSAQQLRTEADSLESLKLHVPEKAIPKTILDAIKVCKALSIQYLWVDSLCIIQDKRADWERESESMTMIYKNAFVTICTPSASASTEGFLARNRRLVQIPFHSRILRRIKGTYSLVASGTCQRNALYDCPDLDVYDTSWNSRGWTLQEYEMSNRLLIFGESMIYFECRAGVSENGHRRPGDYGPRMIEALGGAHSYGLSPNILWEGMIHKYGQRELTFDMDRLPAISGMAKYIADNTGDEYLAGLWKSNLLSSLVWHTWQEDNNRHHVDLTELLNMLRSPRHYISPSWSPVRMNVGVDPGLMAANYLYASAESTLVDASVIPDGDNPFGQIKHGRIRIRGPLTTLASNLTRLPCSHWRDNLWCTLDKAVITYFALDWFPDEDYYKRENLSMILTSSMPAEIPIHLFLHRGSCEEARDCLTNRLCLHEGGAEGFSDSSLSRFEGEADQSSDKAESESTSSLSRESAVSQVSKEPDTGVNTNARAEEDRLDKGGADPNDFSTDSESRPGTPRIHDRTAFGLLLHPLSEPNVYVRVGVWASFAEDGGGIALFKDFDEREVDIV